MRVPSNERNEPVELCRPSWVTASEPPARERRTYEEVGLQRVGGVRTQLMCFGFRRVTRYERAIVAAPCAGPARGRNWQTRTDPARGKVLTEHSTAFGQKPCPLANVRFSCLQ